MDLYNWAIGGALLGFLASMWGQVKSVAWRVISLFVQRIEIGPLATLDFMSYLTEHYKRSSIYDRRYDASSVFVNKVERVGYVGYEFLGDRSVIFWNGWIPFLVSPVAKKQDNTNKNNSYGNSASSDATDPAELGGLAVWHLRGALDFDKIFEAAFTARNGKMWQKSDEVNYNLQFSHQHVAARFFIQEVPDLSRDEGGAISAPGRVSGGMADSLPWYRRNVYRILGWEQDHIGPKEAVGGHALERLIFPPEIHSLIDEIRMWREHEDWYKQRFIPWKRGWILYGPPGTGKSALARAFAEDLDLPLFVFSLSEMDNGMLTRAWKNMQTVAPCIALIEDIDNVFHGRTNVSKPLLDLGMMWNYDNSDEISDFGSDSGNGIAKKKKKEQRRGGSLTFDTLLKVLDGVVRAEGVFTIITTNDITKVDSALGQPCAQADGKQEFLSTRPGRIDKVIELGHMSVEGQHVMAKRILGDYPALLTQMNEYIDNHATGLVTPAQFQERCAQLALRHLYELERGARCFLR